MQSVESILVATDFSPSAERAFTFAVELARSIGGHVHLMHDIEIPTKTITAATTIDERLDEARTESEEKMRDLVSRHEAGDVVNKIYTERSTEPSRGIPVFADENGADLIVIGVHGRSNVKEMLLGSTAERVIRTAGCPVVTIRADE